MPVILAIIAILIGAAIWYQRARAATNAADDLLGAANDIRLAARRFGFKSQSNLHPVDQIEDPRQAAAGIAAIIAAMDGALTEVELKALETETRTVLNATAEEAPELAAYGRWIAGQGPNPEEMARRLGRKLNKLAGGEVGPDLIDYVTRVSVAGAPLDARQIDALDSIRRQFGLA
ncbi:MAG: hypothetical protein ACPGGK_05040 [Pikeienuella sp.]